MNELWSPVSVVASDLRLVITKDDAFVTLVTCKFPKTVDAFTPLRVTYISEFVVTRVLDMVHIPFINVAVEHDLFAPATKFKVLPDISKLPANVERPLTYDNCVVLVCKVVIFVTCVESLLFTALIA